MELDQKFLEKQKGILEGEKKKLQEKISKLNKYPEIGDSDDENAMEFTEFQSNLSLEEQLKYLLDKVNKALVAIDDGTYGRCSECKKAIEAGRLEIMPYAELCISCKQKDK